MRPPWPEIGATFGDGTFATTQLIAGSSSRGRYHGMRLSDGAPVLIAVREVLKPREMVERFKYEGPGVSPLVFVGPPDGYVQHYRNEALATIELRPDGDTLEVLAAKLSLDDVLRIGAGIVAMVAAAVGQKRIIGGIRPETAYALQDGGGWRFSGLAPMTYNLLRHSIDDGGTPFMFDNYLPPEFLDDEINQRSDVFSAALVIWYLATGSHAYDWKPTHQDDNIYLDRRKQWPGPEDVGRVLESALICAPVLRASIDEFAARLHQVMDARGIALPPPLSYGHPAAR